MSFKAFASKLFLAKLLLIILPELSQIQEKLDFKNLDNFLTQIGSLKVKRQVLKVIIFTI